MHPSLRPGSPPPRDAGDVEDALRAVPELAFSPELGAAVPTLPPARAWPPAPDELLPFADPDLFARVLAGLGDLAARAERERSGGLAFLVRTMLHFLAGDAALPPAEHPLLVALLLRGAARARARPDTVAEIARAMDHWGR